MEKLCYLNRLKKLGKFLKLTMNKYKFLLIIGIATIVYSCGNQKGNITTIDQWDNQSFKEQTLFNQQELNAQIAKNLNSQEKDKPFHAVSDKVWHLHHTDLDITFNFKNQTLNGTAIVTLRPYFYPQDTLDLDAKGMDILHVELANQRGKNQGPAPDPLKWEYDGKKLHIDLPSTYSATEYIKISIQYVAHPERPIDSKVDVSQSAVTDDKGLYFINADGKHPFHPQQIWTQGEPQSNSRWFPTLDEPNQKHTHKIRITRPDSLISISNGELTKSVADKEKKTVTDHWEMKKPHAVYLTMMAIGPWTEIKDTAKYAKPFSFEWGLVPVNYYVEKTYAPFAKEIFGNTPEMIEFFSQITLTPYPWNKYDQIVAREFVSGAMENTTAVIHNHRLQDPTEEMEDYISHELFHHWFGDLVTAESWGDLSMNESFATYGEYLWREHKYGKENAEHWLYENRSRGEFNPLTGEFNAQKSTPLIHKHYNHPNDQFDDIRYNKGARILHMLRQRIGNLAFSKSMQCYLEQRAYKNGNAYHWKHCVEEVTGLNMDHFFNSWYFQGGEFGLDIESFYDTEAKKHALRLQPFVAEIPNLNTSLLPYGKSKDQHLTIETVGVSGNSYEISLHFNPASQDTVIFLEEQDSLIIIHYPEPQAYFHTSVNQSKENELSYELKKLLYLISKKGINRAIIQNRIRILQQNVNRVLVDSQTVELSRLLFDACFEKDVNTVTDKHSSTMGHAFFLYFQCYLTLNKEFDNLDVNRLLKRISSPLKTHALSNFMVTELLQLCNFLESGIRPSNRTTSVAQHPALDKLKESQSSENIIAYLFMKANLDDDFDIMAYLESSEFSSIPTPHKSKVLKFLYNERSSLSKSQQLQFLENSFMHLKGFPDLVADFMNHLFSINETYGNKLIEKTWSLNLPSEQKEVVRFVFDKQYKELLQYDWSNPELNNELNRQRLSILKQSLSTNKE
jgi:hypothetical protein